MLNKFFPALCFVFSLSVAKAQMPNPVLDFLNDGCKSEKFINFSHARITIYNLQYAKASLLNLEGDKKLTYVVEQISKDIREFNDFRIQRDRTNPARSESENKVRELSDMQYLLMLEGAMTIFLEGIDPNNFHRISRRVTEECLKNIKQGVLQN